jgi:multidrug efflux pump
MTLTFEAGTNLDLASVEAQNRIKRAEARLPEEVRRLGITVNKSAAQLPAVHLAVLARQLAASTTSPGQLRRGQRAGKHPPHAGRRRGHPVRHRVFDAPVAQARTTARLGLTPADVAKAVRAQNVQLATGELGQLPAAEGQQLNAVIVTRAAGHARGVRQRHRRANADGATVRVKDIARVELGAQDYNIAARTDGQPSAAIAVRMAPGANALDTAKAVKARMAELAKYFPKGIAWVIPYDTSRFVDISIREVVKTLAEAMPWSSW